MGQHVSPLSIEVLRLAVWLIGLVVVFVPLERLLAIHDQQIFRKGLATDLGYYFLNSLLPAVALGIPVSLLAWAVHHLLPVSFLNAVTALPMWARVLAGVIVGEVGYYWGHRLSHQIPFLWRFHAIHHSAEEMDFLVNTRAHPVDMVFSRLCGLVPMYLLGLGGPTNIEGSVLPILVTVFGTFWGFFIHSNVRCQFGPFKWLISTPAFHHWHHTRSGPRNCNYSSTLPWLDWLFGSFYLPNEWPADYGIKAKVPEALVDQLVHPLFPSIPQRTQGAHQALANENLTSVSSES